LFLQRLLPSCSTTAFVWLLDSAYLSERSDDNHRDLARKWMYPVVGAELLLIAGFLSAINKIPAGFIWATLWITLSALFFLGMISWLRKKRPLGEEASAQRQAQERESEHNITRIWTLSLALVMLAGAVAIWGWPMDVGQFVGSLLVACYSFGSFLAFMNLLHLIAGRTAQYASSVGFVVVPRTVMAVFLGFLVLPAFVISLTQSIHRVRLCGEKTCTPSPVPPPRKWTAIKAPFARPTVSDAAIAWYAQAEPAFHSLHPGQPVPIPACHDC
jgi:heme exporter protein D